MAADPSFRDRGEFVQIRTQRIGPQRAVEAEGQRFGVAERVVERLGGLSGQRAPALVGDGARDHDRQTNARALRVFEDGEDGGLGVQRVEDGLHHENVDAALDQRLHLLRVRGSQFLEGGVARARIVHVPRHGRGSVHGAEDARHESGLVRGARGEFVGGSSRDAGGGEVDARRGLFDAVFGHRQPCGAERVRLDDVGPGGQVRAVDVGDDVRPRETQQIVVAEQRRGVRGELVAPEVGLLQPMALDHGGHRPVQHQNALVEDVVQAISEVGAGHGILQGLAGRGCRLERFAARRPRVQG